MDSNIGQIANNRFVWDHLTASLLFAGGPTSKR